MSRTQVALVVGVLIGVAATWFAMRERQSQEIDALHESRLEELAAPSFELPDRGAEVEQEADLGENTADEPDWETGNPNAETGGRRAENGANRPPPRPPAPTSTASRNPRCPKPFKTGFATRESRFASATSSCWPSSQIRPIDSSSSYW